MNQKRRRSWLGMLSRISLRMTLVLVALITVGVAFVADAWQERQRERAFLERLEAELQHRLIVQSGSVRNWFVAHLF